MTTMWKPAEDKSSTSVTLSGMGDLDFDDGQLDANGSGLTFTAPTGKHFKSIVITATMHADISGWTNDHDYGTYTSTWTGDASSVNFNGSADEVTSIVFTLE